MAFEGHICCWHICGSSMVNKELQFVVFLHICKVMWVLFIDFTRSTQELQFVVFFFICKVMLCKSLLVCVCECQWSWPSVGRFILSKIHNDLWVPFFGGRSFLANESRQTHTPFSIYYYLFTMYTRFLLQFYTQCSHCMQYSNIYLNFSYITLFHHLLIF